MKSKSIYQSVWINHPEDDDQKRAITLKQRGNEIHLSYEAWKELKEQIQ